MLLCHLDTLQTLRQPPAKVTGNKLTKAWNTIVNSTPSILKKSKEQHTHTHTKMKRGKRTNRTSNKIMNLSPKPIIPSTEMAKHLNKRNRLDKEQDPAMCSLKETRFRQTHKELKVGQKGLPH